MKLIVGLGNPGAQYNRSRHNVGFQVVDALAERLAVALRHDPEFQADFGRGEHEETKIFLAKPTTYMNDSGQAVQKIIHYYKIEPQNVWLIYDDIDIEFGTIKIKPFGSSAGHKGVESVIEYLQTERFPRFKVGIRPAAGTPEAQQMTSHETLADYVLQPFTAEQDKRLKTIREQTVEAVLLALTQGLPAAMNQYN